MWSVYVRKIVLIALVAAICAAMSCATQQPLSYHTDGDASTPQMNDNPEEFRPIDDLNLLSETDFTTLQHSALPYYNVRVKKSKFCDGTVVAYTGYIDIEARHLFFYFFESRNKPEQDDVIFWTNGGPGGSSSFGLFMELGPCAVKDATSTVFNPYSWNSKADVFFIDQPVGVGFSYAGYGESVSTTPEAAKDIAAFVSIFFERFSKFKGKPFHMAGESYGGRYIPVFASAVYDNNAKLVAAGLPPINLTSVIIGNGATDSGLVMISYYEMQCKPVSIPPIQDISTCVRMKQAIPRCQKMVQESCYDRFESFGCKAAELFCTEEFDSTFPPNLNPFDITKECEPEDNGVCYSVVRDIEAYLSRPDVRATLGVDRAIPANFSAINFEVNAAFWAAQDQWFQNQLYIAELLERGVKALIFAGVNDIACSWVANDKMTRSIEWSGQAEFVAQPLREWEVAGAAAGVTRSAGPLTFATVYGAGHMVPLDKPREAQEMVNRWMAGVPL
ncbi:serine carboxypeptidase [Wolfiporia cocos MD-104 SS10]|uniref:Carboxypeptidase n=1 Tax=Wolfiporia cocos (strain MD-104) TaxID=742152 RepID=A0A2H3JL11_WOLCO|nr:serine carboxypeptidase [Wolfiporia cocos MD-104 SS10]